MASDAVLSTFGEYRVVRPAIARGAFGVLHEAVDGQGRRVALKVLERGELLKTAHTQCVAEGVAEADIPTRSSARVATAIMQLRQEYQTLVRLRHPHIATVYAFGTAGDAVYLAMEFLDGPHLLPYCTRRPYSEQVPLFCQLLEGLAFLHAHGLLHLDVKSENIFVVTGPDGQPTVKLIDFGLARAASAVAGSFVGSVPYMAPEIAAGHSVDARADLFSCAVLMYLCLNWHQWPFPLRRTVARDPSSVRKHIAAEKPPKPLRTLCGDDIPDALTAVVERLLAHDPDAREYRTARAVWYALQSQQPTAFVEPTAVRAAYLRPPGDVHIGRAAVQAALREAVAAVVQHAPDPTTLRPPEQCSHPERSEGSRDSRANPASRVCLLTGAAGLGKTHLLQTIARWAELATPRPDVHRLTLPAPADTVTAWLAAVAASWESTTPVVLLVDDLDEADAATQAALAPLCAAVTTPSPTALPPTLLVATTNPERVVDLRTILPSMACCQQAMLKVEGPTDVESTSSGSGDLGHRTCDLGPLSRAELIAYLQATPALQHEPLPDAWIDQLLLQTNGIPAELVAQLEAIDARGLHFGLDGRLDLAALLVPECEPTLHPRAPVPTADRLRAQYAAAPAVVRPALDLLTVWHWRAVSAPPTLADLTALLAAANARPCSLDALQRTGLVQQVPSPCWGEGQGEGEAAPLQLTFIHPLTATVLYATLPADQRQHWHHHFAQWWAARARTAALPFHFHSGLAIPKQHPAAAHLLRAARLALQHGNLFLSETCCTEVLAWCTDFPKLRAYASCLLIDTLYHAGKTEEAESAFQHLEAHGTPVPLSWFLQCMERGLFLALTLGDDPLATARWTRVRALLPEGSTTPLGLRLRYLHARLEARRQQPDAACAHYRRLWAMQAQIAAPNRSRVRENALGECLLRQDALQDAVAEALQVLTTAYTAHGAERDLFGQTQAALQLAEAHRVAGQLKDATHYATEALGLARAADQPKWVAQAHQRLATIYYDVDHFPAALDAGRRCLVTLQCLPASAERAQATTYTQLLMGHCYRECREWAQARLYFDAVLKGSVSAAERAAAEAGVAAVRPHLSA